MKIMALDPKKGTKVHCGDLINGTYYRIVSKKHFMRVVGGYGIQETVFAEIDGLGCKQIKIKEEETGNKWLSDIDKWREHGHVADYGHGKQRFLSLKYMTDLSTQVLPWEEKQEKPKALDRSYKEEIISFDTRLKMLEAMREELIKRGVLKRKRRGGEEI